MSKKNKSYIALILFHIFLGFIIYTIPEIAKIYSLLITVLGFYYIFKSKNNDNEVLLVAGYFVGIEVFLRMTNGVPSYEFSKYMVILCMLIGMYYKGVHKNSIIYWIALILLLPSVVIATQTFTLDNLDVRNTIMFNLLGPLCLGISAIYCYSRSISFKDLNSVLLAVLLPIISTTVYLILYTPANLKEVLITTSSNYNTSGGFGPNQVATLLGLAMFIVFSRIIFETKDKLILVVNLAIILVISYRGLITFSRGGMITGASMIVILCVLIFILSTKQIRYRLLYVFTLFAIISFSIWSYSHMQTDGLIEKRYKNQDALGREKEDALTGREKLMNQEIDLFFDNPFFGIGIGRSTDIRSVESGDLIASHDEITRLLAEHGLFGIINIAILIIAPMLLYRQNSKNVYTICFVVFWFFTINHAAMRTASPAFIYALSLLRIKFDVEKNSVHREQVV